MASFLGVFLQLVIVAPSARSFLSDRFFFGEEPSVDLSGCMGDFASLRRGREFAVSDAAETTSNRVRYYSASPKMPRVSLGLDCVAHRRQHVHTSEAASGSPVAVAVAVHLHSSEW